MNPHAIARHLGQSQLFGYYWNFIDTLVVKSITKKSFDARYDIFWSV